MRGLVFDCSTTGYVPFGASYTGMSLINLLHSYFLALPSIYFEVDPLHRVCALPGAIAGSTIVPAESYIGAVYVNVFNFSHTALDIGVVVIFWLGLIAANALAMEWIQWLQGGFILRIFKAGRAPKVNDDATEAETVRKANEAANNMKFTDTVIYFYFLKLYLLY
jgi:hypothetical protein